MFETFIAAVAVASLSLIGVFFFGRSGHIAGAHRFIIPVALGMFLGVVFFELVPETLHESETWGAAAIVAGFLGFYLLSHILRGYHVHQHDGCEHAATTHSAKLILIGDAVHNFADGIVIATAFAIDPMVGVATTIGVILHEVPQEIAEFGVLVASGLSRARAALYNLLSASTIILGAGVTLLFMEAGEYVFILTGIAAGNLLYIAASDMIPELHGEQHRRHFKYTFLSTLIGLALIAGLIIWTHGDAHGPEHDGDHAEELVGDSDH